MYKRILVPVDGSRTAVSGLRVAIRLAAGSRARLLLLHVIDILQVFARLDHARTSRDLAAAMERMSRKVVDRAGALARHSRVRSQSLIAQSPDGRAAATIIEEARKWKADLIVMGTHGRRGLSRAVLGSDAEAVVRSSPVPVLLVRSPAPKKRR